MPRFNQPVALTMLHAVDTTESLKSQQVFAFQIEESVTYQGQTLPEGTVFEGTITQIRPSKRLGRPARFTVLFQTMSVPLNGRMESISLTHNHKKPKPLGFYKDRRLKAGTILKKQLLVNVLPLAVTVPLAVWTDVDASVIYAVDAATEMAVGITEELAERDPLDTRSTGKKVATGAFRGIPLIGLLELAQKKPNFSYQAQQHLQLNFPKSFWLQAFTALSEQTPLPVHPPVSQALEPDRQAKASPVMEDPRGLVVEPLQEEGLDSDR